VLSHTTSDIRMSFHAFFYLTVSKHWAFLWALFENVLYVNKADHHYAKEYRPTDTWAYNLFSFFTNIFAYVLFKPSFIITENAHSWNRIVMRTAFRWENLKDRFSLEKFRHRWENYMKNSLKSRWKFGRTLGNLDEVGKIILKWILKIG